MYLLRVMTVALFVAFVGAPALAVDILDMETPAKKENKSEPALEKESNQSADILDKEDSTAACRPWGYGYRYGYRSCYQPAYWNNCGYNNYNNYNNYNYGCGGYQSYSVVRYGYNYGYNDYGYNSCNVGYYGYGSYYGGCNVAVPYRW